VDEKDLLEDLRTTSAQVSATAEHLDSLEAKKRKVEPGDPKLIELSDEIERIAARLRRQTAVESSLSREINDVAQEEPA